MGGDNLTTCLSTEPNTHNKGIKLDGYEMNQGMITGYKVYRVDEQIGTLEFRNNEWIAGLLVGFKIEVKTFNYFQLAYNWFIDNLDLLDGKVIE